MKNATEAKSFTCKRCGDPFSLAAAVLQKYPGWTPAHCPRCHAGASASSSGKRARPHAVSGSGKRARPPSAEAAGQQPSPRPAPPLTETSDLEPAIQERLTQVLHRYTAGPHEGIFTDGGCSGNPGPGGWGAVYVHNNTMIEQQFGREAQTTNNRMELRALIAGYQMIEEDSVVTIWSDSQLCVNTFTLWAPQWEKRGWKRKGGPIKNLDLIKELYALVNSHPRAELRWLKAHAGSRWNEYVDTLATGHLKT